MVLFPMLTSIAGLLKVRFNWDRAIIDNAIFRLHYRTTSSILFVSCIIITANSLIGEPINCITTGGLPENVINTYCWITSTFSLPGQRNGKVIGQDVIYPGVGPGTEDDEVVHHAYYQWVPFMLFFQGILFYVPHWLWKVWEEGRLKAITDGLRGTIMANVDSRQKVQTRLVEYIVETLHLHNGYAWAYIFCEVLNFVNVVGNIFFVDTFLRGAFLTYGIKVVEFAQSDQINRTDPMIEVFPRITKCTFHKYGPSGTIQKHDILCVLALNILNEKIYIFLWFWFIVLSCLSFMSLMYRFLTLASPLVRAFVIQSRTRISYLVGLDAMVRRLHLGDFFLINMLGKNLDTLIYREILDELARQLHLESTMSRPLPYSGEDTKLTNDEKPSPSSRYGMR